MTIAVRCLYYRPITPNFLIIDLSQEQWSKFLWGDKQTRIEIIKSFLSEAHPPIREVAWIPLKDLSDSSKSTLIINLINNYN